MAAMQTKYNKLADIQKLVKSTPILAVGDDHDYGQNDGGIGLPRTISFCQDVVGTFSCPPKRSTRTHPGIYGSSILGEPTQHTDYVCWTPATFVTTSTAVGHRPVKKRRWKGWLVST